jgi:hypothetical protein
MTMVEVAVAGILFSRSVRSSFASLTLAASSDLPPSKTTTTHQHNDDQNDSPRQQRIPPCHQHPILVRIQFQDNVSELRSFCRKHYKLGDYLEIGMSPKGRWQLPSLATLTNEDGSQGSNSCSWSQQPRWVVDVDSVPDTKNTVRVVTSQVWNMKQCQDYQHRYLLCSPHDATTTKTIHGAKARTNHQNGRFMLNSYQTGEIETTRHGGGRDKRREAEKAVEFFLKQMGKQFSQQQDRDPQDDGTHMHFHQQVRAVLNQGSGVLDIAGGSGYVSLALALRGIQSTVIDARSGVGKLPGKDRKLWKRQLQQQAQQQRQDNRLLLMMESSDTKKDCSIMKDFGPPAIIPFQIHRAWFGSKPPGVDQSFRHPDKDKLPIMSLDVQDSSGNPSSPLLHQASALIAVHPDEATADIVQAAVEYRIPFMVVPCCVFARLYPHRRMRNGQPVNTYEDMLKYLQEMDASIQRSELPLEGRNIALWSTFNLVHATTREG